MRAEEAGLVERARQGEVAAFCTLVERHRAMVFGLAYARLGNREDALDVAQEAFVEAYTGLPGLRDATRFRPWLLTILVRRCNAALRARRRDEQIAARAADAASPGPERPHPLSLELNEALAALPPADRRVLTLGACDGLTYREIASRTRMTVPAVRSRMYRARARLIEELRPMSETATTQLTVDVMRRVLARVAELPQPVTPSALSSVGAAAADEPDAAVADVAEGVAWAMEQGEPLPVALFVTHALPRALTGLLWLGNLDQAGFPQPNRGELALRAAARTLDEGLLRPGAPVEPADVALFCAGLGSFLLVGMPFGKALDAAGRVSPRMASLAAEAAEQLSAGRALSGFLAGHPETFTGAFCMIVRLAEEIGVLEMALPLIAGMLWAPETLDPGQIAGPWQEHMEHARQTIGRSRSARRQQPG